MLAPIRNIQHRTPLRHNLADARAIPLLFHVFRNLLQPGEWSRIWPDLFPAGILVFPHAVFLDNPQLPFDIVLHQSANQRFDSVDDIPRFRFPWKAQDGDTCIPRRRKNERIREIKIEGDKAPLLGTADGDHFAIPGGAEFLFVHGGHVMPRLPQQHGASRPKVLIEFQSQGPVPTGIST